MWILIVQRVYLMFLSKRACELCQKEKLTKEWSKLNDDLWDLKKNLICRNTLRYDCEKTTCLNPDV